MPFSGVPWARQDAYARLPFDPTKTTGTGLHAGGITFLDLPKTGRSVSTIAGYVDGVPAWLVARSVAVLIRWVELGESAQPAADLISNRLASRGIHVPVGLIPFEIGNEPSIRWDSKTQTVFQGDAKGDREADWLNRCRRVELASFLQWGGAVWRPSGYHYRLPSGRHSRTFVRLADAFMDIRAAPALATWLYHHVAVGEAMALILDSGTLGPLATELRAAAEGTGGSVSPIIGIDSYPPSVLGLQQRIMKMTDGLPTLGIVSVSDTGSLASQLASVLESPGSGVTSAIVEQIVARGLPEAMSFDPSSPGTVRDPWVSLSNPGGDPSDPPCEACRDPGAARLVQVDPRSMSAMVLPEPELLVPDLTDARRNSSLWEAYQGEIEPAIGERQSWVGLAGPTGTRIAVDSESDLEDTGVFFEPANLALRLDLVGRRLVELTDFAVRRTNDPEKTQVIEARKAVGDDARVVVLDMAERQLFRESEDWEVLKSQLRPFLSQEATIFAFSGSDGHLGIEKIEGTEEPQEPRSVLVVALGLRTGVTLHRMFLAARERWPKAEHRGLVFHAHPHDDRVWASARNTFTDHRGIAHLLALWLSYVPRWSPFTEELEFLRAIPEELVTGMAKRTLTQRRASLEEQGGPSTPFWGPAEQKLRNGSFLGEDLGGPATAAAVGAALQAAAVAVSSTRQPSLGDGRSAPNISVVLRRSYSCCSSEMGKARGVLVGRGAEGLLAIDLGGTEADGAGLVSDTSGTSASSDSGQASQGRSTACLRPGRGRDSSSKTRFGLGSLRGTGASTTRFSRSDHQGLSGPFHSA